MEIHPGQYIHILKYNEDRGAIDGHQYNCLVKWNNINKVQSWINFSALSLRNSTPIKAFAQTNKIIDKMPFFHLACVRARQKLKLLGYR
jgi:hypothetical protein